MTTMTKEKILEATRGLDKQTALLVARSMGFDEKVKREQQVLKDEIESLRQTLYGIQEYGSRNPGCGFSCAAKARDGLSASTQRLP